jgi:hypothetical protein
MLMMLSSSRRRGYKDPAGLDDAASLFGGEKATKEK